MTTKTCYKIGAARQVCRVGVLSSLIAFASAGNSFGQEDHEQPEPLELENLEILRPPEQPVEILFESESGQQIITWSSPDMECWVFDGICTEIFPGEYQYIDLGSDEQPQQFYRFEIFDPEVGLPPHLEQLRAELGEEGFTQWLEANRDRFGSLQGVTEEEIEQMDEEQREQFQNLEELLEAWLDDVYNESDRSQAVFDLPPVFEEARLEWGDYDVAKLLVENLDSMGNLHGICEPLVIEWEELEPVRFQNFLQEEQDMMDWLHIYLMELPPLVLENFEPEEQPLPPHFEQMRQQLGDEIFAQWLQSNFDQYGNYQGVNEGNIPPEGSPEYEEFEAVESALESWLNEFGSRG